MSFLRDNGYVVRLNTSFTHLIDNLPPPKLFHTLPNDYFYFTPHKKIFCVYQNILPIYWGTCLVEMKKP